MAIFAYNTKNICVKVKNKFYLWLQHKKLNKKDASNNIFWFFFRFNKKYAKKVVLRFWSLFFYSGPLCDGMPTQFSFLTKMEKYDLKNCNIKLSTPKFKIVNPCVQNPTWLVINVPQSHGRNRKQAMQYNTLKFQNIVNYYRWIQIWCLNCNWISHYKKYSKK